MIKGFNLPEGWKLEPLSRDGEMLLSTGFVIATIDVNRRVFRGGLTSLGRPMSTKTYSGNGWRVRLLNDAVAWLRSIERPS